jgi:hypothetical protein
MEIKFFYFFGILSLTIPSFGRAFSPIFTRQEGKKAEVTREKRFKKGVWIPAYYMQGLAWIRAGGFGKLQDLGYFGCGRKTLIPFCHWPYTPNICKNKTIITANKNNIIQISKHNLEYLSPFADILFRTGSLMDFIALPYSALLLNDLPSGIFHILK